MPRADSDGERALIVVKGQVWNEAVEYCLHVWPEEACGVFIGSMKREGDSLHPGIRIDRFVPITNIAEHRQLEFRMDSRQWIDLWYSVVRHNQAVIGIVHSHPSQPPFPSDSDLKSYWSRDIPTHWIISLQNRRKPDVRVFGCGGEWIELSYTIQP